MKYEVKNSPLDGVLIFKGESTENNLEFELESFNQRDFNNVIGHSKYKFVQDNQSKSSKNVLRGMHYQVNNPQGKLIRVIQCQGSP